MVCFHHGRVFRTMLGFLLRTPIDEQLLCGIGRDLPPHHSANVKRNVFSDDRAIMLRDIGHPRRLGHALLIDPIQHLRSNKRGHPPLIAKRYEVVGIEVEKVQQGIHEPALTVKSTVRCGISCSASQLSIAAALSMVIRRPVGSMPCERMNFLSVPGSPNSTLS